jgi:hypothetical protein
VLSTVHEWYGRIAEVKCSIDRVQIVLEFLAIAGGMACRVVRAAEVVVVEAVAHFEGDVVRRRGR